LPSLATIASAPAHPPPLVPPDPQSRTDFFLLFLIAACTILLHLLTANRYGFNRDEFSFLEDARHLAWGYAAYPPLTPLFGRLSLVLFGTSLVGFRFFSSLLQAVGVFLTGCMAKEMGGRRFAQLVSAAAAVPFALGTGALMQYTSFDYFFWVLTAYFVVRLLRTADPRYFLLIGASIGLGLLTKYTMLLFAVGVLVGILFTGARRYLRTPWPWLGALLALALFTPNLLWLSQHHFVYFDFLQFLHRRDVAEGLTKSFLLDQITLTLPGLPLWLAGLYFCLAAPSAKTFRTLAWMYLVPLLLFVLANGRGYYLAPAYPMLYAAGAVFVEPFFARGQPRRPFFIRAALPAYLLLGNLGAAAFALPLAPIGSPWFHLTEKVNITLRDEIGWQDLVSTLAHVRDSLPVESRAHLGILVENYGEVGAINLYGPAYGLPRAISGVNSSWERGYGDPPPQTLLIVGFPREFVEANFTSCRLIAQNTNSFGIANEESTERRDIFLCGPPKLPWPQFWATFQYFA
jgi:hypothetical protein